MTTPYESAVSWQGYGRQNQSSKLNDFLYNGGKNLSIQDRAWCADFVNSTLKAGGMTGTGSGMARSFLNWGKSTDNPREGDIAVFSRGGDQSIGHVGYFRGYDGSGNIRVLGGNQGGQVRESTHPASRLLSFRSVGDAASNSQQVAHQQPPNPLHAPDDATPPSNAFSGVSNQSALSSPASGGLTNSQNAFVQPQSQTKRAEAPTYQMPTDGMNIDDISRFFQFGKRRLG